MLIALHDFECQFSSRNGVDTSKYRTLRRGANSIKRESENNAPSATASLTKDTTKDSFFKKTKKASEYLNVSSALTMLQVRDIKGHKFVTTSYNQPTYCVVCKGLIWGVMKQGWTCTGFHMCSSRIFVVMSLLQNAM